MNKILFVLCAVLAFVALQAECRSDHVEIKIQIEGVTPYLTKLVTLTAEALRQVIGIAKPVIGKGIADLNKLLDDVEDLVEKTDTVAKVNDNIKELAKLLKAASKTATKLEKKESGSAALVYKVLAEAGSFVAKELKKLPDMSALIEKIIHP